MSKTNDDIQKLFEPMCQDILIKRPENIAEFMLKWLQDHQKNLERGIQEEDEEGDDQPDDFSQEGNKMMEQLINKSS